MGCRIIEDRENEMAVFYCSTTMVAFGPVMGSREEAEKFIEFLEGVDPRTLDDGLLDGSLQTKYHEFVESYVCECGTIRVDHCDWCSQYPLNKDGKHETEFSGVMDCEMEPEPAKGERFDCEWCKQKRARKQRKAMYTRARKAGLR